PAERVARGRGELPGRAVRGERLQADLAGLAPPAAPEPGVGLRVERARVVAERADPAVGVAVGDLRGDVERLSDIEPAGRPPAERRDEEQVHIGIVEAVALAETLCGLAEGCAGRLIHGDSPVRAGWKVASPRRARAPRQTRRCSWSRRAGGGRSGARRGR